MTVLSNIALIVAFVHLLVIPHELAHLVAGRAVGLRVFRALVGKGRLLLRFNVWGVPFEIYSRFSCSGLCYVTPGDSLSALRVRMFICTAAGPFSHILLIALTMLVLEDYLRTETFDDVFAPGFDFIVANGVLFLASIIPRNVKVLGQVAVSDGYSLLWTPFYSREVLENYTAYRYYYEALECVIKNEICESLKWIERGLERFPDSLVLLPLYFAILMEHGHIAQAQQLLKQKITSSSFSDVEKAVFGAQLAYSYILSRESERYQEIVSLTDNANRLVPDTPYYIWLKSLALAAGGECERAVELLNKLDWPATPFPYVEEEDILALIASARAIAYSHGGSKDEALLCLQEVRIYNKILPIGKVAEQTYREVFVNDLNSP